MVFKGAVSVETFALGHDLTQESSVVVQGTVRADTRSPIGFELGVTDLKIAQQAHDYPITPKEHGVAFLLDHRHLWLRSARQQALLRIRVKSSKLVETTSMTVALLCSDAPIFTPAACEGTTTLFPSRIFR